MRFILFKLNVCSQRLTRMVMQEIWKKSDETVCHLRLRQTDTYLLVSRRDYSNESPAIHQIVSRDINVHSILYGFFSLFTD